MKILHGLVLSVFLLFPLQALAVDIQDIKVYSYLNQPLRAEIPIGGVDAYFLEHLRVRLASSAKFAAAGIPQQAILNQFRFSKAIGKHAKPVIRIITNQAVNEPTLTFLLTFSYPRGTITREFTIMLDLASPSAKGNTFSAQESKHLDYNPLIAAERASKKLNRELEKADLAAEKAAETRKRTAQARLAKQKKPVVAKAEKKRVQLPLTADKGKITATVQPNYYIEMPLPDLAQGLLPAWLKMGLHEYIPTLAESSPQKHGLAADKVAEKILATRMSEQKHKLRIPVTPISKPLLTTQNIVFWLLIGLIGLFGLHYRKQLSSSFKRKFVKKDSARPVNERLSMSPQRLAEIAAQQKSSKTTDENELDPFEEAHVYIKYKRYEQAESVLKDALVVDPGRGELYFKLLEVYAKMGNKEAFAQVQDMIPSGLIPRDELEGKISSLWSLLLSTNEPKTARDDRAMDTAFTDQVQKTDLSPVKNDYVTGKITMAQACIDMHDYANAIELLREIQKEGAPEHLQQAEELLKKIPANKE